MTEQQILTDSAIQQLDKMTQKMANNTRVTLGNTVEMIFIIKNHNNITEVLNIWLINS